MKNKNWDLILGVNYYNSVLIRDNMLGNSINFLYSKIDELSQIESIYLLINSSSNRLEKDKNFIIKTFGSKLKEFMEKPNKKILITTEMILSCLIKEDKRNSFLKFLYKNNRKIIIFHESDEALNYFKGIDPKYMSLSISEQEWEMYFEIYEKFNEVKFFMFKVMNPFANPKMVFQKYKEN